MSFASSGWTIGFIGSAVTGITFSAVAILLFVSLTKTKQWRSNPLGVGTFLLYTTCGGGHVLQTIQLLYPYLGVGAVYGAAAQYQYGDWHLWVADGLTAVMGVWYWTMRKYFPDLVSGTAVYEDLRERHRRAFNVHDDVVQGLARVRLSLDVQDDAEAKRAIEDTLIASQRIADEMGGGARPGGTPHGA